MPPKISVVIVVLNGIKTIENAILSVYNQSYNNFEIVIIDGASTDGTVDILKKYEGDNFHWVSEPDKGIYDAMNKGIKKAKGEWIFFLGADDTFYNNTVLSKIFRLEDSMKYDLIYGNVYSPLNKKKYAGMFDNDKILFSNICHQSIFYKKSIYENIGYYNTEYKLFADWDFNIKCFLDEKIRKEYIPLIIANYSGSGITSFNSDLFFLRNYLFPKNLEILEETGLRKLYSLRFYDKWWRLIRSLKLTRNEDTLSDYVKDKPVPLIISRMHSLQKKVPYQLILNGAFSKFLMFISYLTNLSIFRNQAQTNEKT